MEAVLLPGILDGLSGRLGLMPPGVVDPPTSTREGVSQRWAATLREAVMMTEGREVNPDWVSPHVVHPGLHQDYNLDFQMQRVDDIAPTLTSPMLAGLISSIRLTGGPKVPKGLHLPRWKRACGVMEELLLSQMYQAPHTLVDPWRQRETNCWSRGESILMPPSLHLPQRTQLLLSYQMTTRLASLVVGLRPSLHQKLSWLGATSNPRRTGVHACLLQRGVPQKKRSRVRLLVKQLSREGCRRKTSSPRDMKSLPQITTGCRA